MKSTILGITFLATIASACAQTTTFNYATPVQLTASDLYTTDVPNWTALQEVEGATLGQLDIVNAQRLKNSYYSIPNYTFNPGYTYTVSMTASVAVGNSSVANSSTAPIMSFGVGAGTATYTTQVGQYPQYPNQVYASSVHFPQYETLIDYATTVQSNRFGYAQSVDYLTPFLTTIYTSGSFYNTVTETVPTYTTPSMTATSAPFTVTASIGNLLIESFPGIFTTNSSTLNITSVSITATPIVATTINGGSTFYFSSSVFSGNGTIQGAPGHTVTVTVSASGPPPGNYSSDLVLSGATFVTNTSGSSGTVVSATNGSNTATFVMPASGQVSWSGNFSEPNSDGGGGISVN